MGARVSPGAIARCEAWLEKETGGKALLVPSCTAALEAAVVLAGVGPGDEVILPSFAYPTCASSILRAGGTPVFADIDLDTLHITGWEGLVTARTKAIMPIWYAGVQGRIDSPLPVIEDAAQCIANYTLRGDFGCISFHHSKNVGCGEGGALIVRHEYEKARTFNACGTTRWKDRKDWTWLEVGTSNLMAEPLAEILEPELEAAYETTEKRLGVWKIYRDNIKGHRAFAPGNGHLFWFMSDRQAELLAAFPQLTKHYEALHTCKPGRLCKAPKEPTNSLYAAKHILRPPMTVTEEEAYRLSEQINRFT